MENENPIDISIKIKNKNSVELSNGVVVEMPFDIDEDTSVGELNKILSKYIKDFNLDGE